mmetsp:Transcript_25999/g.79983  ORF Transcript_25999/g.79983 Transcript_25999/m.79983 type:complete len:742 (-) Transcript_25999:42-2267(-)
MASRLLVVASVAFAGLGLADADAAERRLDDGSGVKIYGGDDAPKKYQWMTRFNGCGGALVSSNAVMTAAHCVDSGARTRMTIGAYDLEDPDAVSWNAEVRDTARVAIHPDWGRKGEGDIALVFFDKPVNLEPIKLGRDEPSVGSKVFVTGWEGSDRVLQQAKLFVHPDGICRGHFEDDDYFDDFNRDNELCAGRLDASQQPCSGDSGGPLFKKEDGEYVVYGVVNRGPSCPDTYDVYASVAAHREWIEATIAADDDGDNRYHYSYDDEDDDEWGYYDYYYDDADPTDDDGPFLSVLCPDQEPNTNSHCDCDGDCTEDPQYCACAEAQSSACCGEPRFLFYDSRVTWEACKETCDDAGLMMPCITDISTNFELFDMSDKVGRTRDPWIGYSCPVGENCAKKKNWAWNAGCASSYTNWMDDEPNNFDNYGDGGGENVALFRYGSKWNDVPHDFKTACYCEVPPQEDYSPSYRPTARPQDDAVSSPTYPPTSQPSSKQPSQRPTAEPVPQPTPGVPQRLPACDDDVTWTKADKGCEWVGAFAEKRCVVKGDDGRWAFEGCRATCDTCLEAECPAGGDSETWTHESAGEADDVDFKTCEWVADFSGNRCAQKGVDGTYAYQSCGPACRTCGLPESCGADDAAWYKASEPAKTCAWVGAATGVRCDALGADGKFAYEACPAACRACGGAFGECADDVDFFKKGDPAKGCEWIASATDAAVKAQRCLAKGEDAGYAFLACPVACGTC